MILQMHAFRIRAAQMEEGPLRFQLIKQLMKHLMVQPPVHASGSGTGASAGHDACPAILLALDHHAHI